jgi:acetamidase/formamidase
MKRFARTPPFTGPDDPERGQVRGVLPLGEAIVVESVGGHDQDYVAIGRLRPGDVMEVRPGRQSRPAGLFHLEEIRAGDWVAIHILDIQVGPYGFYRNGGPFWASMRLVAPVRDGLIHFPPDFVVPVRPMIGVIELGSVAPHPIDHGGNMDFNAIQPGSTVHIRAQKPGGYLSLGDTHARMGDGELTAAGVEIDASVTLKVDRSPGFPNASPVVEKTRTVEHPAEWLTSGIGPNWGEAIKKAWTEMVALLIDRYDTTFEYANMIVGTIADARPGMATEYIGSYCTVQLAVTKELRRTGQPYRP